MLPHPRVPSFWFFVYKLFSSWIWLKYCLLDLKQSINSHTLLYPALLMCRHCFLAWIFHDKGRGTLVRSSFCLFLFFVFLFFVFIYFISVVKPNDKLNWACRVRDILYVNYVDFLMCEFKQRLKDNFISKMNTVF